MISRCLMASARFAQVVSSSLRRCWKKYLPNPEACGENGLPIFLTSMPDFRKDCNDYAERIRDRLPRRHQELREAGKLSMYALWLRSGVSRDTISRIEGGETIPGMHVLARLARGMGVTLEKFFGEIEDDPRL